MTFPPDAATPAAGRVTILPVPGLPEVRAGDDLAGLVAEYADGLRDGDIVVVSSKVVSKSEGRVVTASGQGTVEDTDAVRAAAVEAEAVRIVARRGTTRIVQTRHGFVMAAAGVDASNVPTGSVLLLPVDPDASARALRRGIQERLGVRVGVVVTDTFGRPWRLGQVDLAVGAAGVRVLDDYKGRSDVHGNELAVTAPAHADEVASAAELVKGKVAQVPVAIVRGLRTLVTEEDGPGARALVRPAGDDMFRLGSQEAAREALRPTVAGTVLTDAQVDPDALRRALSVVGGADQASWGFAEVDDAGSRKALLDAVGLPSSAYPLLAYVRTGEAVDRTSVLLEVGGMRDRLVLASRVEGLATCWLGVGDAVRTMIESLVGDDAEPIGLLAVGAPQRPR